MIEDVLKTVPDKWWYSIERPLNNLRATKPKHLWVNPKKRETWLYTVYISNGEMIGTPLFASAYIDGDILEQCIRDCIDTLYQTIESKKEAMKKAKPEKKRR